MCGLTTTSMGLQVTAEVLMSGKGLAHTCGDDHNPAQALTYKDAIPLDSPARRCLMESRRWAGHGCVFRRERCCAQATLCQRPAHLCTSDWSIAQWRTMRRGKGGCSFGKAGPMSPLLPAKPVHSLDEFLRRQAHFSHVGRYVPHAMHCNICATSGPGVTDALVTLKLLAHASGRPRPRRRGS